MKEAYINKKLRIGNQEPGTGEPETNLTLINFHSSNYWRLHMKFDYIWLSGFRVEVV